MTTNETKTTTVKSDLVWQHGNEEARAFLKAITGVDCVCERSAVMLALDTAAEQAAALLAKKESLGGVTAALAFIEPEFGGAAALR